MSQINSLVSRTSPGWDFHYSDLHEHVVRVYGWSHCDETLQYIVDCCTGARQPTIDDDNCLVSGISSVGIYRGSFY